MIKQYTKGRVFVFIDAANILYSQQTLGWRVDYKKLKEYFEKECELFTPHQEIQQIIWYNFTYKTAQRQAGC